MKWKFNKELKKHVLETKDYISCVRNFRKLFFGNRTFLMIEYEINIIDYRFNIYIILN